MAPNRTTPGAQQAQILSYWATEWEGDWWWAARKYSVEFKDACVQEVLRNSRPIAQVARENGVVEQTLGVWVSAYKKANSSAEPELSVSEWARTSPACRRRHNPTHRTDERSVSVDLSEALAWPPTDQK